MLVHQNWESETPGFSSVRISDHTVNTFSQVGTVHSGVQFGSDGVLSTIQHTGGFSAVTGEWLLFGASSQFYIKRTITEGTLQVDAGASGGFIQMNANLIYDNQKSSLGRKITKVSFEISSQSSGVPVVAIANMEFESFRSIQIG